MSARTGTHPFNDKVEKACFYKQMYLSMNMCT